MLQPTTGTPVLAAKLTRRAAAHGTPASQSKKKRKKQTEISDSNMKIYEHSEKVIYEYIHIQFSLLKFFRRSFLSEELRTGLSDRCCWIVGCFWALGVTPEQERFQNIQKGV